MGELEAQKLIAQLKASTEVHFAPELIRLRPELILPAPSLHSLPEAFCGDFTILVEK
ncbi:MAG TPA: hypothetical protein VFB12_19940 [Ktedonobacteraceae bacterium]|nr:hypothetical protein [Ktedonobacteraceae bacterium]